MAWTTLQLTNAGKELMQAMISGQRVQFTKIKMGSGNAPTDISTLTDLVTPQQTLPIQRFEKKSDDSVLIGGNLLGESVTTSFTWKESGLFARNLDGETTTEVLFSYQSDTEGTVIPVGGLIAEFLFDMQVTVSNAENVTVEYDSSTLFVTKDELTAIETTIQNQIDDLPTFEDVQKMVFRYYNDISTTTTIDISNSVSQFTDVQNRMISVKVATSPNNIKTSVRLGSGSYPLMVATPTGFTNISSDPNGSFVARLPEGMNALIWFISGLNYAVLMNAQPIIANSVQARQGTSNQFYMTPARTKETVGTFSWGTEINNGNSVIIVGGTRPTPIAGKTIIWIDPNS